MGNPFNPSTTMGSLNNAVALDKMLEHMRYAYGRKANIVKGGSIAASMPTNLYFEPTVVTGLNRNSLLREESFGSVAPVLIFEIDEQAFELVASSPYGLNAAVFTNSIRYAFLYTEILRAGLVNVNEKSCYQEPHIPAGGMSGTNGGLGRTGGRHTLMDMCDLKTITIDINR